MNLSLTLNNISSPSQNSVPRPETPSSLTSATHHKTPSASSNPVYRSQNSVTPTTNPPPSHAPPPIHSDKIPPASRILSQCRRLPQRHQKENKRHARHRGTPHRPHRKMGTGPNQKTAGNRPAQPPRTPHAEKRPQTI